MGHLSGWLLSVLASWAPGEDAVAAARAFRQERGAEVLRELAELVALENVTGDREALERNAAELVERFRRRGFAAETVEIAGSAPLVVGRLEASAAGGATRTLGLYAHYDGQPVVTEAWTHPPFKPTLLDGSIEEGGEKVELPESGGFEPGWRLYGRAAADDKAPIAALLGALDALEAGGIGRTADLVLLLEGEEESGSANLAETLLRERGRFAGVDIWLVLDGPVHASRRPQLVFGARGVTSLEITVYGALRSLHSGHYGNWAPNPAAMLAELLASMRDGEGRILIEGFYDPLEPPGEAERAALAALPAVEEGLMAELGLGRSEGEGTLAERLLYPAINVRGLASGAVGELSRNAIPPDATASLDVRLVPGYEPGATLDRIEAHVRAQGYEIVRDEPDLETRRAHARVARVVRGGGYPSARTPLDLPAAAFLSRAVERASGAPPLLVPSLGGSVPLYVFSEVLDQPFVVVPIANPDNNQHAPDENLLLANLAYGIDLFAAILADDGGDSGD